MYVVNVTFSLDPSLDKKNVYQVVKDHFVAELMEKKIITDYQFLELVKTAQGETENTITCQVKIDNLSNQNLVEDIYKPRLDHKLFINFGEKCLNFTTFLKQF